MKGTRKIETFTEDFCLNLLDYRKSISKKWLTGKKVLKFHFYLMTAQL